MPFDSTLDVSVLSFLLIDLFLHEKTATWLHPDFAFKRLALVRQREKNSLRVHSLFSNYIDSTTSTEKEESRWLHHSTLINLWREYTNESTQASTNIRQTRLECNLFTQSTDSSPLALFIDLIFSDLFFLLLSSRRWMKIESWKTDTTPLQPCAAHRPRVLPKKNIVLFCVPFTETDCLLRQVRVDIQFSCLDNACVFFFPTGFLTTSECFATSM